MFDSYTWRYERKKVYNLIILYLGVAAVLILLGMFFITIFWRWVVPDVFSGAVEQGILPRSLSFWEAFKLSVLLGVLGLKGKVSYRGRD